MGENFSSFVERHIGPGPSDIEEMLSVIGCSSLDILMDKALPPSIRMLGKWICLKRWERRKL